MTNGITIQKFILYKNMQIHPQKSFTIMYSLDLQLAFIPLIDIYINRTLASYDKNRTLLSFKPIDTSCKSIMCFWLGAEMNSVKINRLTSLNQI